MDVGGPPNAEEGVGTAALGRLDHMDDALAYATYFIFYRLRSLVLNRYLCSVGEEWCELLQYVTGGGKLWEVFQIFQTPPLQCSWLLDRHRSYRLSLSWGRMEFR